MDTSKEYVQMCEKATEIQALKRGIMNNNDHFAIVSEEKLTFLPRQDQLQEMIGDYGECVNIFQDYIDCVDGEPMAVIWDAPYHIETMEQLWLAFVMYKKYNKAWNGEDWIMSS